MAAWVEFNEIWHVDRRQSKVSTCQIWGQSIHPSIPTVPPTGQISSCTLAYSFCTIYLFFPHWILGSSQFMLMNVVFVCPATFISDRSKVRTSSSCDFLLCPTGYLESQPDALWNFLASFKKKKSYLYLYPFSNLFVFDFIPSLFIDFGSLVQFRLSHLKICLSSSIAAICLQCACPSAAKWNKKKHGQVFALPPADPVSSAVTV